MVWHATRKYTEPDTAKARQDLERLGIRSGLWLGQTKNGKCLKPQAAYSFTPENQKKFYQGGRYSALEGGPIHPRWMFPFERYMKKLKGYVQNKTKPEGAIAEGYVAEEAVTFNNNKDLEVSTTSELFALACGPTWTPISINYYVVDGVRYVVHSRDERCTTQNSGICSLGPDEEMYYGRKVKRLVLRNNMTQINTRGEAFKNDQYILVTQVKQVFYLEDKVKPHWKVVEHVNHKKFIDGGVIVVEDDPDIIHFNNSSDLLLSTSLNDLDNATLHIDGQSTEVDAPPDIIDVVDEDDDIIDDEDALPHDLVDSDDEDLINVDDDDVARSHGSDGDGEDRPHHTMYPPVAEVASLTETQFDLRAHMESPDWTEIHVGIQQHLQKAYNTNKAAFKAQHWVIDPTTGTYNVKKIRRARPQEITAKEWDKYIQFWNDPRNIARVAQNRQNRAKSTAKLSHSGLPSFIDTFFVAHTVNEEFLQDEDRRIYEEMRRLEATGTYTDDEINRLARGGKQRGHILGVGRVLPARATASPSTPAHESTLNSLHKKVDFMMSLFKSDSKYSNMFLQFESCGASGSGGCGDDEESADDQDDEDKDGNGDS
nr:F-box domain, leucine-rich repeat domain, L domain-like protein [Tanacetum cinerariifolium]